MVDMARSLSQFTDQLLQSLAATEKMSDKPTWHDLTPDMLHQMQINANRLLIYGEDANAARQAGSDVLMLLETIEILDKVVEAYGSAVVGQFKAHFRGGHLADLSFTPDPPASDLLEK